MNKRINPTMLTMLIMAKERFRAFAGKRVAEDTHPC